MTAEHPTERDKRKAAEAEAKRYREALERIAAMPPGTTDDDLHHRDIARVALGSAAAADTTEAGEYGLQTTHRYYAPGVWRPKETTPACDKTYGPWACACAHGHEGLCRNSRGETLPAADTTEDTA